MTRQNCTRTLAALRDGDSPLLLPECVEGLLLWLCGGRQGAAELPRRLLGDPETDSDMVERVYRALDADLFTRGELNPVRGTRDERQARYRLLVRAFHPDRYPLLEDWLISRSQAINAAYAAFRANPGPDAEPAARPQAVTTPPPVNRPPARVKTTDTIRRGGLREWFLAMAAPLARSRYLPQKIMGVVAIVCLLPVTYLYYQQPDQSLPSVDLVGTVTTIIEAGRVTDAEPAPETVQAVTRPEPPPAVAEPIPEPPAAPEPDELVLPAPWTESVAVAPAFSGWADSGDTMAAARQDMTDKPPASTGTDVVTDFNALTFATRLDSVPERTPALASREPDAPAAPPAGESPAPAAAAHPRESTPSLPPVVLHEAPVTTAAPAVTTARATADEPPPATTAAATTTITRHEPAPAPPVPRSEPEPAPRAAAAEPASRTEPAVEPDSVTAAMQVLEQYRRSFERGELQRLLDTLAARPRENDNIGLGWFRETYRDLFDRTVNRQLSLDFSNMRDSGQNVQLTAQYQLDMEFENGRRASAAGEIRYELIPLAGDWKINLIQYDRAR